MLDLYPDDSHIKIIQVAETLSLGPDVLLTIIRDRHMAKVFLAECLQEDWLTDYTVDPPKVSQIGYSELCFGIFAPLGREDIDHLQAHGTVSPFGLSILLSSDSTHRKDRYYLHNGPAVSEFPPYVAYKLSIADLYISVADAKRLRKEIEEKQGVVNTKKWTKTSNGVSPKREKTLLKVIGALLTTRYTGRAYIKGNGNINVDAIAEKFDLDLANAGFNNSGIGKRTIADLIPLALEAIEENKRE